MTTVRLDTPCIVIPGQVPEGAFGLILQILLKARLELQLDAGSSFYEEDVNAYLGGVLVSYVDSQYLRGISEVVSKHDVDVHESIDRAMPDKAQMYRIYKANADDLLVSLGVFRLSQEPEQAPEVGRIKEYYACASDCQKRIYGKPTAVAEIQNKLSESTERYLAILSKARREYLHFVQQIPLGDLDDFFSLP